MEQSALRAARLARRDDHQGRPQRTSGRSRAASGRPWRSPARCSASRASCCSTSPRPRSGVSQTEQVLNLIHTLRERGLGVVVISHNLENVFAVADRIVVLRLGRRAATFDVRGASREDVVAAITGAEFGVGSRASRKERRMSADTTDAARRGGIGGMLRALGRKLAQGEAGTLLVILMVAVIWTFFQFQNDRFLSPGNLTNLMLQQAAVATISIGVVLILLLGEIDLSVGAVERLLRLGHGGPDRQARRPAACWRCSPRWRSARLIGLFNGFMVTRFRIPSFVVTLAGSLTLVGSAALRARRDRDDQPRATTSSPASPARSSRRWSAGSIAAVAIALTLAFALSGARADSAAGLQVGSMQALIFRVAAIGAAFVALVFVVNQDRGLPLVVVHRLRPGARVRLPHRAHALRAAHVRGRRQRRGRTARRHQDRSRAHHRLRARLDARRLRRRARRLTPLRR